jgi:ketosteroid isomerase-like protein
MMRTAILALAAAQALSACSPAAEAQGNDDLAARVQALEDEKEIRRVLVHYGEYLDARDFAGYAGLFARDGVWTGGFGTFTGPAAIEAMLVENMGAPEPGFVNRDNFHLMTTMVVDVDGDTAKARSRYLFMTRTPEDRPSIALAGRYEDTLVREDGAWKIQRRITHGVIPHRDGNAPPPARPPAQITPSQGQ